MQTARLYAALSMLLLSLPGGAEDTVELQNKLVVAVVADADELRKGAVGFSRRHRLKSESSQDGSIIVVPIGSSEVRVVEVANAVVSQPIVLFENSAMVDISISPTGDYLAVQGVNNNIELLTIERSGEMLTVTSRKSVLRTWDSNRFLIAMIGAPVRLVICEASRGKLRRHIVSVDSQVEEVAEVSVPRRCNLEFLMTNRQSQVFALLSEIERRRRAATWYVRPVFPHIGDVSVLRDSLHGFIDMSDSGGAFVNPDLQGRLRATSLGREPEYQLPDRAFAPEASIALAYTTCASSMEGDLVAIGTERVSGFDVPPVRVHLLDRNKQPGTQLNTVSLRNDVFAAYPICFGPNKETLLLKTFTAIRNNDGINEVEIEISYLSL